MQRSEFRHWLEVPIRWGDMDALGHVNNVQYFRYFESGRIAYLNQVLAATRASRQVVLADIQCTFLHQLHYPGTVEVGTRSVRLGTSSLHLNCGLFLKDAAKPAASCRAVLVCYDFRQQQSAPLSVEERTAIAGFDEIEKMSHS